MAKSRAFSQDQLSGPAPEQPSLLKKAREQHGMTESSEYEIWCGIKKRCTNPKCVAYKDYGGRGVTMHPEWEASFSAFLRDVGARPGKEYTIDRFPNNDGNYEPGNIRWATKKEQANNRRSSRLLEVDGVTKTLMQWGEVTGLGWAVIKSRLDRGFSVREAVTASLSSRGRKGDSYTGIKGVYRHSGKFRASIRVAGRLNQIGTFKTIEEAAAAYQSAREKFCG
jgi:hypothetical protein